ncbi:hypothetical protein [Phenylobacterium sp.]|uniref:hypothetical protein n=1 Tax=Phenylobacterium sp. TaxID=1871053 RepID=UPI0035B355F0
MDSSKEGASFWRMGFVASAVALLSAALLPLQWEQTVGAGAVAWMFFLIALTADPQWKKSAIRARLREWLRDRYDHHGERLRGMELVAASSLLLGSAGLGLALTLAGDQLGGPPMRLLTALGVPLMGFSALLAAAALTMFVADRR